MNGREVLDARNIMYPDFYFNVFGHHALNERALERAGFGEKEDGIEQINKYCGSVILSSENYSIKSRKFFELVRENLDFQRIKVVYYYRTPSDRLFSFWQEKVKHGSSTTFAEYSVEKFFRPFIDAELNYVLFYEKIQEVFGPDTLVILDHKTGSENNSLLASFFNSLGLQSVVSDTTEKVNSSLPYELVELLRALNGIRTTRGNPESASVREQFFRNIQSDDEDCIELLQVIRNHTYYIDVGNTAIDEYVYKHTNTRFAKNVFGEISSPISVERPVANTDWTLAPAAQKRLHAISKRMQGPVVAKPAPNDSRDS